ncbi:MAG: hypothetical protein SFX73_23610 [Kofleriaceae bacterium]|nr:hypothetical protein [Kofleriaceae bacterium]
MTLSFLSAALCIAVAACSSSATRPQPVPIGTTMSDKPSILLGSESAPKCAFEQVPGVSQVDEHDSVTTLGPGQFARRCDNGFAEKFEVVAATGASIAGPERLKVNEQAFYDTEWQSAKGRHAWPLLADASGEHTLDANCAGIAEEVREPPSHGMGGLGHLHGFEIRGIKPGTCTVRVANVVGSLSAEKTITVVK